MEMAWINPQNDRYYSAGVRIDLLGDVVLERHWGSTRTRRHGGKPLLFATLPEALAALESLARRRKKRGYERTR